MKKLGLLCVLLLSLSIVLFGCSGDSAKADDVISTLEDEGYVFEERDNDSKSYYQTNMINEKFDLSLEVTALYVGYINSNERWVEIVALKNESQAEDFKQALVNESIEGRLIIQESNVIIITFSQDTANLFLNK
jgi:hypothetical protein